MAAGDRCWTLSLKKFLVASLDDSAARKERSYDGEIIVWNGSTEKALKKLRPHDEREGCKEKREESDSCAAVTRLFFIPGRTSATTTSGGADLVSCGGSGVVRLWSTKQSCLVGQFTAHKGDLGSIVMAVSPCGKYLTTADREGTVKIWDVEDQGMNKEFPKLLRSFRPHLDHVTHLEMCLHGDKLLLLSASSDCNVALSCLPGETAGLFGQKDPWCLERPGALQPQWETQQEQCDRGRQEDTGLEGMRSPLANGDTNADQGHEGGRTTGDKGED